MNCNCNNPSLVGILNNSVNGYSNTPAFVIEDTLFQNKWINVPNLRRYVYRYSNSKLGDKFFIQILPEVNDEEREELKNLEILQNVLIDSDVSKTTYYIYAKEPPSFDIKITVLVNKIK